MHGIYRARGAIRRRTSAMTITSNWIGVHVGLNGELKKLIGLRLFRRRYRDHCMTIRIKKVLTRVVVSYC